MNLNRLHRVALGQETHRGCGKTFYALQCAIGAMEVGHDPIVIVLPVYRWLNHVIPMLKEALTDRGYHYHQTGKDTLMVRPTIRFVFITKARGWQRALIGTPDTTAVIHLWRTKLMKRKERDGTSTIPRSQ